MYSTPHIADGVARSSTHSKRRSNNGLARQVVRGSLRGHRPSRHSPSDPASQTERRHRLKCPICDCLREVSRLRKGCFVPIFQNFTYLHHVSFSQGLRSTGHGVRSSVRRRPSQTVMFSPWRVKRDPRVRLDCLFHSHSFFAQEETDQRLGIVHFKTSCNEVAQRRFNRAMRYQHSFWYRQPRELLEEMLKAELSEGQARIFWPINFVAPECDFGLWNSLRREAPTFVLPRAFTNSTEVCLAATFPALPDTPNPYWGRNRSRGRHSAVSSCVVASRVPPQALRCGP